MEQAKGKIKFSRLRLSQKPSTSTGAKSLVLSANKTQISSFFNKTKPVTNQTTTDSQDSDRNGDQDNSRKRKITTAVDSETEDETQRVDNNGDESQLAPSPSSSTQTISKTCRKIPKIDLNQSEKQSETITNFFSIEKDDPLEDFQIRNKTMPKSRVKKRPLSVKKKAVTKRKQPDIRKCLQKPCSDEMFNQLISDHCAIDEVDPDQFQLALAVSRSLADEESRNRSNSCSQNESEVSDTVKKTIEKFSFKSKYGKNSDDDFANFFGVKKSRSRSNKWKNRCTPLTRRKDDIQNEKVRKKIEDILLENVTYESKGKKQAKNDLSVYEITSVTLRRHFIPERLLFVANGLDLDSRKNFRPYYTNNLVTPSKTKADCLLRDWSLIPGRDSVFDSIPAAFRESKATEGEEDLAQDDAVTETDDTGVDDADSEIEDKAITEEISSAVRRTSEDLETTVLLDIADIQMKLDVINTQIQNNELSTSAEIVEIVPDDPDIHQTELRRDPSPDLFGDCDIDDDYSTDSESKNNEYKNASASRTNVCGSPTLAMSSTSNCENDEAKQVKQTLDTVIISSSESHSNSGFRETTFNSIMQNLDKILGVEESPCIEISDDDDDENDLPIKNHLEITQKFTQSSNHLYLETVSKSTKPSTIKRCSSFGVASNDTKPKSQKKTLSFTEKHQSNGISLLNSNSSFKEKKNSQVSLESSDTEINYFEDLDQSEIELNGNRRELFKSAMKSKAAASNNGEIKICNAEIFSTSQNLPLSRELGNFGNDKKSYSSTKCSDKRIFDPEDKNNKTFTGNEFHLERFDGDPIYSTPHLSQISQDSIEISDDEINYSMNKSTVRKNSTLSRDNEMATEENPSGSPNTNLNHSQPLNSQIFQMSQDSIVLSDDEINYSMNKSRIKKHSKSSNQAENYNNQELDEIDIDVGGNSLILPTSPCLKPQEEPFIPEFNFNDTKNGCKLVSFSVDNDSVYISDDEEGFGEVNPAVKSPCSVSYRYDNASNFEDNSSPSSIKPKTSFSEEDMINKSVSKMFEFSFNHKEKTVVDLDTSIKFRKTKSESFFNKTFEYGFELNADAETAAPPVEDLEDGISSTQYQKISDEFDRLVYQNCASQQKISTEKLGEKVKSKESLNQSRCLASDDDIQLDLSNKDYIIKVGNISPKPDFENMDHSDIIGELKKYGLKISLRKRQAIICLEHIYNRTHPYIEDEPKDKCAKRSSLSQVERHVSDLAKTKTRNCSKDQPTQDMDAKKLNFNIGFSSDNLTAHNMIHFEPRDGTLFLPSCPRLKKPWCLQPLHIAWYNLLKANAEVHEHILQYKPINLHELKYFFKTIEMTFDNKELITFLDIHCITFQTNRNIKKSNLLLFY